MNYRFVLVLLVLVSGISFGNTAMQIDWSSGDGVPGPVTEWGHSFDNGTFVNWTQNGEISLSSVLITPVMHTVDPYSNWVIEFDVADIDGNGTDDVVSAAYASDEITWWDNSETSPGVFSVEHIITDSFDRVHPCVASDIDGDGDIDIVGGAIAPGSAVGGIRWWENIDGSGTNWSEHTVLDSIYCYRLKSVDIDNDGDMDLVASGGEEDKIIWLENDNGFGISWTEHLIKGNWDSAFDICPIDMDMDGDIDIVGTATIDIDNIIWFENYNGFGTSWVEHVIDGGFNSAAGLHVVDLDNDGDLDVLGGINTDTDSRADYYADDLVWWKNMDGSGTIWNRYLIEDNFGWIFSISSIDIDNDGYEDVFAAARNGDEIAFWENLNGNGLTWTKHIIDDNYDGASCVFPIDINNDGHLDVIGSAAAADVVSWWEIMSYPSQGTLESSILDLELPLGEIITAASISSGWSTPDYTDISFQVRGSDDYLNMGSWSPVIDKWGGDISDYLSWDDTYFQYKVLLDTDVDTATPVLFEFTLDWTSVGGDIISVTKPSASSVWTHFETDLPIEWQYPSLLDVKDGDSGETITITLFDGATEIATLVSATENDGSWIYAGPVPMEWTPGSEYRVYLEDNFENYGWSEYFTIEESTGQEVITVTAPGVSTTWEHYQTSTEVLWEYPALLSGDSVRIEIYDDGSLLGVYADWTANDGGYIRNEAIDPSWGAGSKYDLKVSDNLGNYGWSERFTISTADVIGVTEPTSGTEWVYYTTGNTVTWNTAGLQSTSVDIVLYKNGSFLETLVSGTNNDGTWTFGDIVPDTWEIGSDYQIKIVDNYSDWGWSDNFSVVESSGAAVINVSEPSSSTVWTHFDIGLSINWHYPSLLGVDGVLSGDLISIALYDGENLIETLVSETANDGSWIYAGPVPMDWTPGSEYRVYLEDNFENFGWSEYFTIEESTGQEVITVTAPGVSTIWEHYQTSTEVLWEYPALLSGDSVRIDIYDDGDLLGVYASWTANDGEYIRSEGIDPTWGMGSNYQLKVTDNLGNYGMSIYFTIVTTDIIDITEPDVATEWMHYSSDNLIEWDAAGLQSHSVDITLYKGGTFITTIATNVDNEGTYTYEDAIPETWSISSDYQIKIVDDLGDWGWSEEFTVSLSSGAEVIEITEPGASTVWTHFDTDLPVEWQYPTILSGDSVSIFLYDDETLVDVLTASTPNDGSWLYEELVPMNWTPGTEYRLYIEDDLANYGWSEYFEVAAASGQEVITVTAPTSSTIWEHYETDTEVLWEYPAILSGDSIKIDIYESGTLLDTYADWTANDGEYIRSEGIDPSWGEGSEYTLNIYDEYGNYGWSDAFYIVIAEVIDVTEPSSSTEWIHYTTDNSVIWNTAGLQSTTVDIGLYKAAVLVETLVSGTDNDGLWIYEEAISDTLEIGSDYQIKIVDNYSDWGWSEEFTVSLSSGAEVIEITEPGASTVWTHFDTDLPVEWQYPTILTGDSVSIFLYDDETLIDVLTASTPNDGSWRFEEIVPVDWTPGTEYRLYIEDDLANYGWSEYFEVAASSGQEVITVINPDSSTVWTHFEEDLSIDWEYPAILSGDSVSISLYDDETLVSLLIESTENSGTWVYTGPVPMEWTPGVEYRIYIKDNLENFGWSEYFEITPSSGAEVVIVTQPDSLTQWNHLDTNTVVEWNYPAMLLSSGPLSGDSVMIELYSEGARIAEFAWWMLNTGSYTREEEILETWGTGVEYQIKVTDNLDNWGMSQFFSIQEYGTGIEGGEIATYRLLPIVPNPATGSFAIRFRVPEMSQVSIGIFDLTGRLVTSVVNEEMATGSYSSRVSNLPAGVYICRMESGTFIASERVVVIR